jgi:hypothetical protein
MQIPRVEFRCLDVKVVPCLNSNFKKVELDLWCCEKEVLKAILLAFDRETICEELDLLDPETMTPEDVLDHVDEDKVLDEIGLEDAIFHFGAKTVCGHLRDEFTVCECDNGE